MTPDERNMLADLANKIAKTPPPPRDSEAEDFIRKNIGNRPDALYLMTQTVLIQNMALEQAQQQIQQLQQQAGAGVVPSGGSFLGGRQAAPPPPGYGQTGYGPPQSGYPPPGYGPGPAYGPPPGGGSSFLRSAATTAAGVAGGMLAFQGVEALLGGLTHGGFGGVQSGFLGGGGAPGETIIENNYYDDPNRGGPGHDPSDRFAGDSSNLNDNTNLADDGLAPDDNTDYSDASFDDGSSGGSDDLV